MPSLQTICARCGMQQRPQARFCRSCGLALAATGTTRRSPAAPSTTPGDASRRWQPGMMLGTTQRYQVTGFIGRGGFGQVYLAQDLHLDRRCVVKRLVFALDWSPRIREIAAQSFAREAMLLVTLNDPGHPSIPEIYEYLPEHHALVMKYIDGQSVASLLEHLPGGLPEDETLRIIRDVCHALNYMHSRKPEPVLHRDIKPENILRDDTGRVWLIDFGLAKAPPAVNDEGTASGPAGTPGYAPPEQWQGRPERASDIYALAVTLYRLLTNKLLPPGFAAPTPEQLANTVQSRGSSPLVRLELARLIAQSVAAEPGARPGAQQFLQTIDALRQRLVLPKPIEPPRPPPARDVVGRALEIERCEVRLAQDHALLLTGMAGIGKTTLAATLAQRAATNRNVFWHRCSTSTGAEGLVQALANFLAYHDRGDLWVALQYAYLNGTQLPSPEAQADLAARALEHADDLLVIDDLHLLSDTPLVRLLFSRLLDTARSGKAVLLLVARTAPPYLSGVASFTMPGLNEDAVRSLIRGRELEIADDLVTQLARTTAGNPQILHLAVNALRDAVDSKSLIDHLAVRQDIERYLLHEVDAHLNDDERAVMGAVALLFEDGGSADTVEALLERDVRRILITLQQRHMLELRSAPGNVRLYGQHAIIRSFYYEQLGLATRTALHRRAAHYYEQIAGDLLLAARHASSAGDLEAAVDLVTHDVWTLLNDGRAALLLRLLQGISVAKLSAQRRIDLHTVIGEAATLLGDYTLAQTELHAALAAGALFADNAAHLEAQARRRRLLAQIAERTGNYDQAEKECHSGLDLVSGLSLPNLELARLYAQLAEIQQRRGSFATAVEACDKGLQALPAPPLAARERALLLFRRASNEGERGHYGRAIRQLEESLAQARLAGDQVLTAGVLHNLALYAYNRGDLKRAQLHYEESLELEERLGNLAGQAATHNNLALVALATGDDAAARQHLDTSSTLSRRLGLREDLAWALGNLGHLHYTRNELDLAQEYLCQAQQIHHNLGSIRGLADTYYRLGDVALARHDPAMARQQGAIALEYAQRADSPAYRSCALRVLGEALLGLGQPGEATGFLREALRLQENEVGDPYDTALTLAAYARLALAAGRAAEAINYIERGLDIARTTGIPFLIARLLQMRADIDPASLHEQAYQA